MIMIIIIMIIAMAILIIKIRILIMVIYIFVTVNNSLVHAIHNAWGSICRLAITCQWCCGRTADYHQIKDNIVWDFSQLF